MIGYQLSGDRSLRIEGCRVARSVSERVAEWFVAKYRTRLAEVGLQRTCDQMRKQGIPPDVAALILFGRQGVETLAEQQLRGLRKVAEHLRLEPGSFWPGSVRSHIGQAAAGSV